MIKINGSLDNFNNEGIYTKNLTNGDVELFPESYLKSPHLDQKHRVQFSNDIDKDEDLGDNS